MDPPPEVQAAGVSFIAGCAGGAVQALFGHPFDTVKVGLSLTPGVQLLQVNMQVSDTADTLLTSAKEIAKAEGLQGFYRGLMAPLSGVATFTAIEFGAYNYMKTIFEEKGDTPRVSYFQLAVSGAFSGVCLSFALSPFELVKSNVQVQKQGGTITTLVRLLKTRGPSYVLGTGLVATLLREVPGNMAYFVGYEFLKSWLSGREPHESPESTPSATTCLIAGGVAGCSFWTISYPMDIVKTRLQTAPAGRYSGILDCAKQLFQAKGPKAFYRGFAPCFLRAFPANAITFLTYEYVVNLLS